MEVIDIGMRKEPLHILFKSVSITGMRQLNTRRYRVCEYDAYMHAVRGNIHRMEYGNCNRKIDELNKKATVCGWEWRD